MYTDCKSAYAGSIPTPASKKSRTCGDRLKLFAGIRHTLPHGSPLKQL
jgi:hypothetical protein